MARGAKSTVTDPSGRFNSKLFADRVSQLDEAKAAIGELRGEVSQIWKFVEDHGGNKQAMRMALKIRDMPDGTRNDFLSFLETYCQWLNVFAQTDMFGHQPGLPQAPVAAAELPIEEAAEAPADDGIEEVTIEQIDAAETEGYEDARVGRAPGFAPFDPGSLLRVAYDRGYGKRVQEVSGTVAAPAEPAEAPAPAARGRGRPSGRGSRVTTLKVGGRATGAPRGRRRGGQQQPAAE